MTLALASRPPPSPRRSCSAAPALPRHSRCSPISTDFGRSPPASRARWRAASHTTVPWTLTLVADAARDDGRAAVGRPDRGVLAEEGTSSSVPSGALCSHDRWNSKRRLARPWQSSPMRGQQQAARDPKRLQLLGCFHRPIGPRPGGVTAYALKYTSSPDNFAVMFQNCRTTY